MIERKSALLSAEAYKVQCDQLDVRAQDRSPPARGRGYRCWRVRRSFGEQLRALERKETQLRLDSTR